MSHTSGKVTVGLASHGLCVSGSSIYALVGMALFIFTPPRVYGGL